MMKRIFILSYVGNHCNDLKFNDFSYRDDLKFNDFSYRDDFLKAMILVIEMI